MSGSRARNRKWTLVALCLALATLGVCTSFFRAPLLVRWHASRLQSDTATVEERCAAADAIGKLGTARGIEALGGVLDEPAPLWQRAAKRLLGLGRRGARHLCQHFDRVPEERQLELYFELLEHPELWDETMQLWAIDWILRDRDDASLDSAEESGWFFNSFARGLGFVAHREILQHCGPMVVPRVRQALVSKRPAEVRNGVSCVVGLGPVAVPCLEDLVPLAEGPLERDVYEAFVAIGGASEVAFLAVLRNRGAPSESWIRRFGDLENISSEAHQTLRSLLPAPRDTTDAVDDLQWTSEQKSLLALLASKAGEDAERLADLRPWAESHRCLAATIFSAYVDSAAWFEELGDAALTCVEPVLAAGADAPELCATRLLVAVAELLEKVPVDHEPTARRLRARVPTAKPDHCALLIQPLLKAGWQLEILVPMPALDEVGGGVVDAALRAHTAKLLAALWPESGEPVLGLLREAERGPRHLALEALASVAGKLSPDVLGPLVDVCEQGDVELRRLAAEVIATCEVKSGTKEDAARLVACLDDEDALVRASLIAGIADIDKLDYAALRGKLTSRARDPDSRVRRVVLPVLARVYANDGGVVEVVAGALEDEHVAVREAALRTLDDFVTSVESAHAGIVRLLGDDTPLHDVPRVRLRVLAESVLRKIGRPVVPALRAGREALRGRARIVAQDLIEELTDDD